MRIIVTGGRHRDAFEDIYDVSVGLDDEYTPINKDVVVVHGACPTGVDASAVRVAERRGYVVEAHPADWEKNGRAAGPIRNEEMAAAGAELCLAFPSKDSKGTWDMVKRAVAHGIETRIYPEKEAKEWTQTYIEVQTPHGSYGRPAIE